VKDPFRPPPEAEGPPYFGLTVSAIMDWRLDEVHAGEQNIIPGLGGLPDAGEKVALPLSGYLLKHSS
jgi:hypothetical protein